MRVLAGLTLFALIVRLVYACIGHSYFDIATSSSNVWRYQYRSSDIRSIWLY
jgi:hypothetical protein